MDKELIFVLGVYWITCTAYVIYYFNKNYRLDIGVIIMAIFLGPIIALIMKNPSDEKYDYHGDIRNHIPDFRRTTAPPPPPKKQDKIKDFKFFQK